MTCTVCLLIYREDLFAETSIEHIMGIFSTVGVAEEARTELIMEHDYKIEDLYIKEVPLGEIIEDSIR